MNNDLAPVLHWLGEATLPEEYAAFLRDLSKSTLVNDVVLLYSVHDIIERNETYEVKKYCPGHLSIGDDSGGSAIVISISTGSVGIVDHGSMMPQDIHVLASSFSKWQESGYSTEYEHRTSKKTPNQAL